MVFDGPEDYHARIDDPTLALDDDTVLVIRGVGPIGYPGAAEVVNMRAPDYLLKRGIRELPCIGDGRQSGTSGSPSILNASPEAATGGGLALLQTGDRVRIDLGQRTANMLVPMQSSQSDAKRWRRRAATRIRRARLRGRRSSAASSTSCRTAWCSSRPSSTSASPRPRACRATTTEGALQVRLRRHRSRASPPADGRTATDPRPCQIRVRSR